MKRILCFLLILSCTAILSAQTEPTTQSRDSLFLFISGTFDFENGFYEQAIQKLLEYTKTDSENLFTAEAMYYIGKSFAAIDSTDAALSILEQTYENFPFDDYGILSLCEIGDIYFSEENYAKALLFYNRFVYFNSPIKTKDHAFLQIEKCNYYLGIFDNPTEIYIQFIEKYPRSSIVPKLRFELANYYVTVLDYPAAIDEYNSIIDTYPYCTWLDSVYYNLSLVYKSENLWNKTVQTTIELLNRFPNSELKSDSYELFINGLIANHQFLQAIDTLNTIIESVPQDERNEYYRLLTQIYKELGLTKELVYIYQIMIQNETDAETVALLRLELELIKAETGTGEDTLKPVNHELER